MHLLLGLLFFAKLSILGWATPSLPSKPPNGLYLLLDANTSFSNPSIHSYPHPPFELSAPSEPKKFHVPNTYITLLWINDSHKPIVYKLLRDIIYDAIDEVTSNVQKFGNIDLPASRDPFVEDKYGALDGVTISIQSPSEGPAYGRRLTWGNVRDALVGLGEIMIKGGRPYKTTFEIWNDNLGLIGNGEVASVDIQVSLCSDCKLQ
ncbi:hypothetical protein BDR22DRAFT_700266 [Usnea florida]